VNWLFQSIGDFKFGDSCKRNEIEVLKSKKSMDVFEEESCMQGHHTYKQVWTPFVGKELTYSRD